MGKRQSREAPAWMREIVEGVPYQTNLRTRMEAGILPPNLEMRVLEYVIGKPAEEINLTVDDFSSKSTDELLQIAGTLQEELRQLREASSIH